MKTKEFIRKAEGLGLKFVQCTSSTEIYYESYQVAYIRKSQRFYAGTTCWFRDYLPEELQEKTFNLLVEYARTPIEEREEPKKYYLKHKWLTNNGGSYNCLNFYADENQYLIESGTTMCGFKTKFTLEEIEELKKKLNTDLKDFEIVEVQE